MPCNCKLIVQEIRGHNDTIIKSLKYKYSSQNLVQIQGSPYKDAQGDFLRMR